jgi:uncharacterized cupin superfamily protein
MTAAPASAFLPAREVLDGALPVRVPMEPIVSGAPFAYEKVVYDGADGFFAVWACDAGVYPRVKDRRGSFMYILAGDATITDRDGGRHELTPGSVLVLPYGWAGRWDIRRTIRKVYLHTTPVPPFRPGVQPSAFLPSDQLLPDRVVFDGPDGRCAVWSGEPGGYPRVRAGSFCYVLSGEATVTDLAGTARRLTAGSALALPRGWRGTWEIRQPMRVLQVDSAPAGRVGDGV